ncbi:MAG: PepSY domain-containing protein [Parvibaculum sedimenti]|uniref:PepSY domain-containing protein n=1 Tax=Parvibaculum sedimenti TaxID=2608632 RepID=UPI003BB74EB0
MRKMLQLSAVVLAMGAAVPAFAEEEGKASCGNAPREQWLSEDAIKAKGTALGYEVRRVKAEDGCYELYVIDKNGAKAELYFNPVTGERVNGKEDD